LRTDAALLYTENFSLGGKEPQRSACDESLGMTAVSPKNGRISGLVVPNSATLLEDEAQGRPSHPIDALRSLQKQVARENVDAVISISPFWLPEHSFCVDASKHLKSVADYLGYAVDLKYDCPGDPDLAQALIDQGRKAGLPVRARRHGADHSSTVAMHYLFPKRDMPLIPLSSTELSLDNCLKWGQCIRRAVEAEGKNVLLLCGGGLSYNLTACLHWDDSIAAVIFDQKVIRFLEAGRGTDAVKMDPYWIEVGNPTAGFRDLFIFLGAVGKNARGKLLAYEGAPGVGWAVIRFD
jgi:3,4-dihydroxyphenylacetate 2,3-dioxygenase